MVQIHFVLLLGKVCFSFLVTSSQYVLLDLNTVSYEGIESSSCLNFDDKKTHRTPLGLQEIPAGLSTALVTVYHECLSFHRTQHSFVLFHESFPSRDHGRV